MVFPATKELRRLPRRSYIATWG